MQCTLHKYFLQRLSLRHHEMSSSSFWKQCSTSRDFKSPIVPLIWSFAVLQRPFKSSLATALHIAQTHELGLGAIAKCTCIKHTYAYVYMCIYIYTYVHIYIYIYIYMIPCTHMMRQRKSFQKRSILSARLGACEKLHLKILNRL